MQILTSHCPEKEDDRTSLDVAASTSDAAVKAEAKIKLIALDMNAKAICGLIVILQKEDMLNKFTLQQNPDLDWPTGKLLNIWKEIYKEENPKDKMAEMTWETN